MPIRKRGPWWHYRFNIAGREYAGSTGLLATEDNRKAAQRYERTQRELAKQGREAQTPKDFAAAAGEFVGWCKDVEYRQKASTAERIRVSFASLVSFFGDMPVVSNRGDQRGYWEDGLVFSSCTTRHPRVGCRGNASSVRCGFQRKTAKAPRTSQSQRVPFRPGSFDRRELAQRPFVAVNWSAGTDSKGQPIPSYFPAQNS